MVLQVEHVDAINNLESILDVEGVDGIFIGPYDLSGSLDCLGDLDNPVVINAVDRVFEACKERGMPVGTFCPTGEAGAAAAAKGYDFVATGLDLALLQSAYMNLLNTVRG